MRERTAPPAGTEVRLTDRCAEDVYFTQGYDIDFEANGLAIIWNEKTNEFFPLDEASKRLVADDRFDMNVLSVSGFEDELPAASINLGQSFYKDGSRFLGPDIRLVLGDTEKVSSMGPAERTAFATEQAAALAGILRSSIEAIGGSVGEPADYDDFRGSIRIPVRIPIEYASSVAKDVDGWKRHLRDAILEPAFDCDHLASPRGP